VCVTGPLRASRAAQRVRFTVESEEQHADTPLKLAIMNQVGRFSLEIDVTDRVPRLQAAGAKTQARLRDRIIRHLTCTVEKWHQCAGDYPPAVAWLAPLHAER